MIPILELLRKIFFYAGYLSDRTRNFKKPLSPMKEKEYIQKYMGGDQQAREVLIEHNLRLVAHIAKKYTRVRADGEDLISIGTIGLIKGINTFNLEKGSQLANYIARCIENEILMFLRADKKNSAEVSLGEPIGEDKEGNKISLLDVIGTDEADVDEQVDLKIQAEKLLKAINICLTQREKTVILLRYGLEGDDMLPQREIAKKLGISRSYVSRIEKKALKKLNREMCKKNIP